MLAPAAQRASLAQSASSRFIYERPVRGDEFLNRTSELRMIFSRLHHGASTVISGTPRLGKSSLLLKVADETIQLEYLGEKAKQCLFVFLDLYFISSEYTPSDFWEEALASLSAYSPHAARLVEQAATDGYSNWSLMRLFNQLGQEGPRLVLLLDQFEWLLTHQNFKGPAFFGLLRSLATLTRGLAIVAASRLRISQMQSWGVKGQGSSSFNYMTQLRLAPFDEETVAQLLERAGFDAPDRAFIRRLAGRHPFELQCMATTLLETTGEEGYVCAAKRFYERIAFHFDELWYSLDNRLRRALVILSLLELAKWVQGERFNYQDIEPGELFGRDLRLLAEEGLAKQIGVKEGPQNGLLWRGERWSVSRQAFLWWVWDVVIAETRRVLAYSEWLFYKRYRLLLSDAQWQELLAIVRNAPEWAKYDIGGHSRADKIQA
ncbi:MAG: hypothetical protein ACPGWR_06190 [Ardenticatenaceae bacterium]